MLSQRAEAGSRPAASDFLLLRQKKVTKEKAIPSLRPLRDAKGQTCVGAVAGCAAELTARCALRSDNHGELDNEACALRRACSPRNRPAAGAASRGGTAEQPHGPLLRSASRSRREAPARAGPSEAMARVDVRSPGSLQDAPRSAAASGSGLAIV